MKILTRILFAIAFGATLWGVFELMLWRQGTPEPEAVTLEQLGRLDGTTNVHLAISDFRFGDGYFQETDSNGQPVRCWLPLVTREGNWTPRPVVAWIGGKFDEAKLEQLVSRPVLTGIVTNSVQWVGAYQRAKLNETYTDHDFSNALAFNIDRVFPTTGKVTVLFVIGILALIISIPLLVREIRSATPRTVEVNAEVKN